MVGIHNTLRSISVTKSKGQCDIKEKEKRREKGKREFGEKGRSVREGKEAEIET